MIPAFFFNLRLEKENFFSIPSHRLWTSVVVEEINPLLSNLRPTFPLYFFLLSFCVHRKKGEGNKCFFNVLNTSFYFSIFIILGKIEDPKERDKKIPFCRHSYIFIRKRGKIKKKRKQKKNIAHFIIS